MVKQQFGSKKHTGKKLDVVDKYHGFYPLAMKGKGYKLLYIDAFAGTGEVLVAKSPGQMLPGMEAQSEIIEGSAVRALRAALPYDGYIFIEKSKGKLEKLQKQIGAMFPLLVKRCQFICDDANNALQEICSKTDWKRHRAVIFLDPFGNQIDWKTLEAIANTRSADVWYLFPTGLGIYRQIPKKGEPQEKAADSVTRILGSEDWKFLFLSRKTSATDLFGETNTTVEADATVTTVTEHVIARLKTIFKGGVLSEYVVLGGKAVPWYSLVFACSNPGTAAKTLAHKVAKWIVTRVK